MSRVDDEEALNTAPSCWLDKFVDVAVGVVVVVVDVALD